MKTKITALLLAFVMVFSLFAGCGTSAAKKDSDDEEETPELASGWYALSDEDDEIVGYMHSTGRKLTCYDEDGEETFEQTRFSYDEDEEAFLIDDTAAFSLTVEKKTTTITIERKSPLPFDSGDYTLTEIEEDELPDGGDEPETPAEEPIEAPVDEPAQVPSAEPAQTEEDLDAGKDPQVNLDFEAYCSEFLLLAFGDDIPSWNSLFANPEDVGYYRSEDVAAEWYGYYPFDEESQEYYDELLASKEEFDSFDPDDLYSVHNATYNALYFFFNHSLIAYGPDFEFALLDSDYVSQYGGYVASFASSIENYKYRTYQDFIDAVDMTTSTEWTFPTYADYAQARIDAGLPLTDYTLSSMIDYLDGITESGTDYYLFELYAFYADQAVESGILTEAQRDEVVSDFNYAMENSFLPAVKQLSSDLSGFMGQITDPNRSYVGYAGKLGKRYYKWALEEALGYEDIDLDEYGTYMESLMEDGEDRYTVAVTAIYGLSDEDFNACVDMIYAEDSFLGMSECEEMMDWLLEAANEVVYPLATQPEITFKEADESVQEIVNYTAYYVLSALDEENSVESITINPYSFEGSPSDLLDTLAHEGYPGHLYQHVHSKELGVNPLSIVFDSTGACEGWAQYASYKIFETAADNADADGDAVTACALRYLAAYNYYMYVYSAYIDYVVNCQAMNLNGIMKEFDCSQEEAIGNLHYCDENVAGITPYAVGFAKIIAMHEEAEHSAIYYTEQDFNEWLLQDGMPYLPRMEELTEQYIADHH